MNQISQFQRFMSNFQDNICTICQNDKSTVTDWDKSHGNCTADEGCCGLRYAYYRTATSVMIPTKAPKLLTRSTIFYNCTRFHEGWKRTCFTPY